MTAPDRYMETDFVNERGLEKRTLGLDEVAALTEVSKWGLCLDMTWGTRAPRYCGKSGGHPGQCVYLSPLQIQQREPAPGER